MSKALERLRAFWKRRAEYLTNGRAEIAESNLRFLRVGSTAPLFLLLVLLLVASLVIRSWAPSAFHLAFVPCAVLFCAGSWAAGGRLGPRPITALCVLFETMVYGFAIVLDTLSGPTSPSSFTQLVCMALPALFILPGALSYGMLLAAEGTYLALVLTVKDPFIAQYDIFGLVTGLLFSLCVSALIASYRLRTFELKAKYERLSKRDELSSLYNKRALLEQARSYLKERGADATCALAFIDLDDFRTINATQGHPAGDAILADLGKLLREQFRPTDNVGRFGGDEFVVLVDGLCDEELLARRFVSIRTRFHEQARLHVGMDCGCSIGVVTCERGRATLDELIEQADRALYRAKGRGKNLVCIDRHARGNKREGRTARPTASTMTPCHGRQIRTGGAIFDLRL